MIEFDAVNGRRVRVRSAVEAQGPHGLAKLLPAGAAGGLSTEVMALAYGPADALRTYVESTRLRELERTPATSGTAVMYAVPSEIIAQTGLPAETRVGMLELGSSVAHAFFYRPFNRMEDVVGYFDALAPSQGLRSVTVPTDRFQVAAESYTAAVPDLGSVSIQRPQGVPASRRRIGGGSMWVDQVPNRTTQVVYEDRAVRLSFRPTPQAGATSRPRDRVSSDFEQAVVGVTRGLTTTSWS